MGAATVQIGIPRAAKALLMSPKTLYKWALRAKVQRQDTHDVPRWWLDELVLGAALNFTSAPSIEELLWGRVVLLKPEDAQARLKLPKSGVLRLVAEKRLAALKLSAAIMRYDAASVEELRIPDSYVTAYEAAHIIGMARDSLRDKRCKVQLPLEPSPLDPKQRIVLLEAVKLLLLTMLPDWIDVDSWVHDRQHTTAKMLSPPEAMQLLGVSRGKLAELLEDQWLEYCVSPGGQRMISPTSVADYLASEPPMTDLEIALFFGTTTTNSVGKWRAQGKLECPRHKHRDGTLWRACVLAIAQPLMTPGMSAIEWHAIRRGGRLALLPEAAEFLGLRQASALALAEKGELRGIRTPGGQWGFTTTQLKTYKRGS